MGPRSWAPRFEGGWRPPPPEAWGPPPPGEWGPPPPDRWGPPPPEGWGHPGGWGPRRPPSADWGLGGPPPAARLGPPLLMTGGPLQTGAHRQRTGALTMTTGDMSAVTPGPGHLLLGNQKHVDHGAQTPFLHLTLGWLLRTRHHLGPCPPYGFPSFPPPVPPPGEVMQNPVPDQPEWIKALILAPPTDATAPEVLKDEAAEKPEPGPTKAEAGKASAGLGLLGKPRVSSKPPPGRYLGVISLIGPNFGHIEREDQEKFTFDFKAFYGDSRAMKPGVSVHFTACKEKGSNIATDVNVAPGGTENVDLEIYEGVVSQSIAEPQSGERQYPGQVVVDIGPLRTNLPFLRKDSAVTLLENDRVLINLLTDVVSEKKRATNIRPQIPSTFTFTKETRLKGVITSLQDDQGVIKSDLHPELPFSTRENLSDVDFTEEDLNEEVEFSVVVVQTTPRAVRIQRVKEPLLLTLCTATTTLGKVPGEGTSKETKEKAGVETGSNLKLDPELYEGVVVQPVVKPTQEQLGVLGKIQANIGSSKATVAFDQHDSGVTLLRNDQVLINLLVDVSTGEERATNIRAKIPFTFNNTQETRLLGIIASLGPTEGLISSQEHGELPFDVCEHFSDTEFTASDVQKEVEFTVAEVSTRKRAIRLRRTRTTDAKKDHRRGSLEKKKKEEVTAALNAALNKWTPIGFKFHCPDSKDDVSKDWFEGTVLRVLTKTAAKNIKKEAEAQLLPLPKEKEEGSKSDTALKTEDMDEDDEKKDVKVKTEQLEVKEENDEEAGLLVTTIGGDQKQLPFGHNDLMSSATMMVGDKVKFHIASHRDTKVERATFVEILPESLQESTEERHHGIVIEFSELSGLIKCSENPQLFFLMSEVMEKKKLQLNERVMFTIAPHRTLQGAVQAVRIKRYVESFLHSFRKSTKEKMTIKLMKATDESDKVNVEAAKMKAVVKNLRSQNSKTGEPSIPRRHARSKSRSPPKDQFGRVLKKRSDRRRRSRSPEHSTRRTRSRSRSRSRHRSRSGSRSRSKNRSRSRSRSRDRGRKKRSTSSKEHDSSQKRRRELKSPPCRTAVVDDELVRKKRELEELNEMIAYKKSLVDFSGPEPGHKTCIDYDHGRVAVPLTEYKQVRPILRRRPVDHPEYHYRSPYLFQEPYYRPYSDPYTDPYRVSRLSTKEAYDHNPPSSHRYNDRYDVYDEPYDSRYHDSAYVDPQGHVAPDRSLDGPVLSSQSVLENAASSILASRSFKPPSPRTRSPRSPSPQRSSTTLANPPLDHFLVMLGRKAADSKHQPAAEDGLLPHERAVEDGRGFSRIVGLTPDQSSNTSLADVTQKQPTPEDAPNMDDEESKAEPYHKIQNLLRTIGLKLSSGEMSKLEKEPSPKSSSREREVQVKVSKHDEKIDVPKKVNKTSGTPMPPPEPPPANYSHPPIPAGWPLLRGPASPSFAATEIPPASRAPPGPPPGPPPPRRPEQPVARTPPGPPPGPPPRASFERPQLLLSSNEEDHPPGPLTSPAALPVLSKEAQATMSSTVAHCLHVIKASLASQQPARTSKSVQFSLPAPSPQASNHSSSETEEELKTRQPRMNIYNQADKKLSEEDVGCGVSAGRPFGNKKPRNVWICGHSLVCWAESQAQSLDAGAQLGLDPRRVAVWWKGWAGMTWPKLLPELHQLLLTWPRPQVLILHLGGNDLSAESPTNLLTSVRKELMSIRSVFPDCLLVWSNILPRRSWAHSSDSHEADLVRTTVNRRIHNIFSDLSGSSLTHDNIRCGANTGLYQVNGIQLSQKGIGVFNANLKDFLEKWEKRIVAPEGLSEAERGVLELEVHRCAFNWGVLGRQLRQLMWRDERCCSNSAVLMGQQRGTRFSSQPKKKKTKKIPVALLSVPLHLSGRSIRLETMYRDRPPLRGGYRPTFEGRGAPPDRPHNALHYGDERNRPRTAYYPDYPVHAAYRRSPPRQGYPPPGSGWSADAAGERAPSSLTSLPVNHTTATAVGHEPTGAASTLHPERYGGHSGTRNWSRDGSPDHSRAKNRGRSRSRPGDGLDRARAKSRGRSRSQSQSPDRTKAKRRGRSRSRRRSRSKSRSSSRGQSRVRPSSGKRRRSRSRSRSSSRSSRRSSSSSSSSSSSRSSYDSDHRPKDTNQQRSAWYQKEVEEIQNQPTKSILKKRINPGDSPSLAVMGSPPHSQPSNMNQFAEQLLQAVKGMEPRAVADMLSQLRSDPEMALRVDLDAEIREILSLLGPPASAATRVEKASDIDDEEKFLYGDCDEPPPAAAPPAPSHQHGLDLYRDVTEETLYGECSSQKVHAQSPPPPPLAAGHLHAPPTSAPVDAGFPRADIQQETPRAASLPTISQRENDRQAEEEYEKIQDLLKTIGLDLGLSEISKMAARTKERLHGNKPPKTPTRRRRYSSGSSDSSPRRGRQSHSRSHSGDRAASWSSDGAHKKSSDPHKPPEYGRSDWNPKSLPAQTLETSSGHPLCPGAVPNYPPPQVHAIMPPAFPPYSPYGNYLPYMHQQWPPLHPAPAMVPPPTMTPTLKMTPPPKDDLSEKQNMESQKQKVLEEREKLKLDRDDRMKKKEQLMKELESLRKQQGELLRKKRREKDGHKDPLLQDISNLQEKLISQIHTLRKEHEAAEKKRSEIDKVALILGLSPSDRPQHYARSPPKQDEKKPELIQEIRCKTPPKTLISSGQTAAANPGKDSVTAEASAPSSEPFEYYDAGNHWCQDCNVTSGSMFDFFTHLHSKHHRKTLDPYNRPWVSPASKMAKAVPQEEKLTKPAKGSEFMLPVRGFYCLLCKQFYGDAICAEEHVTRHAHNEHYKKMTYENHLYEQRRNLDRQASLTSDHKKRKQDDDDDDKEEEVKGRKDKKEKKDNERKEEDDSRDGKCQVQSGVAGAWSALDEKTKYRREEEGRSKRRVDDKRSRESRHTRDNEQLSKGQDSKAKPRSDGLEKPPEPAFKPFEAPKIFCGPSPAMRAKLRKQNIEATKPAAVPSSAPPPSTFGKFQWKKKESQLTREAQKMAAQFIREEELAVRDKVAPAEDAFSKSVAMAKEIAIKLASQSTVPAPAHRGRGSPHFQTYGVGLRPPGLIPGKPADVNPLLSNKSSDYITPDPKTSPQTPAVTTAQPVPSALKPGPSSVTVAPTTGRAPFSVAVPPPTSVGSPTASMPSPAMSPATSCRSVPTASVCAPPSLSAASPVFKAPLPVNRSSSVWKPAAQQTTVAVSEENGPDVAAPGVPESEQAQAVFVKPPPFMNIGAGPPKQDKPKRNLAAAKAQDLFGIFYSSVGQSGPSLIKQPPSNAESNRKSPVVPELETPSPPLVTEPKAPQVCLTPDSKTHHRLMFPQARAGSVASLQASADVELQAESPPKPNPCEASSSGSSELVFESTAPSEHEIPAHTLTDSPISAVISLQVSADVEHHTESFPDPKQCESSSSGPAKVESESATPSNPEALPHAPTDLQIASVWSLQVSAEVDSLTKSFPEPNRCEAASSGSSQVECDSPTTLNPELLPETVTSDPSGILHSSNQNQVRTPTKRKGRASLPVQQARSQTRYQTRQQQMNIESQVEHAEPSPARVHADCAVPDARAVHEPAMVALDFVENLEGATCKNDSPDPNLVPVVSSSEDMKAEETSETLLTAQSQDLAQNMDSETLTLE
ncbi:uncharacterized protein znf318 [Synchiropus picturatus]